MHLEIPVLDEGTFKTVLCYQWVDLFIIFNPGHFPCSKTNIT